MSRPVTVAQLIEELHKFPPESHVLAMTWYGLKPAHAHQHVSGDIHVLGLLIDDDENKKET